MGRVYSNRSHRQKRSTGRTSSRREPETADLLRFLLLRCKPDSNRSPDQQSTVFQPSVTTEPFSPRCFHGPCKVRERLRRWHGCRFRAGPQNVTLENPRFEFIAALKNTTQYLPHRNLRIKRHADYIVDNEFNRQLLYRCVVTSHFRMDSRTAAYGITPISDANVKKSLVRSSPAIFAFVRAIRNPSGYRLRII